MTEPFSPVAGGIRILANPKAGRGAAASQLDPLRRLAARASAGFVVSKSAADLTEQARRAVADGISRLLVAGGDGTLHHAVQGLAGSTCALGVIPLGTGNDLAGTLGVPPDLELAMARALRGPVRPIDLLRVGKSVSLSYAGVGFDAEVTRFANRGVRFLRGHLVYVYAVLHTLVTFVAPTMRVEHDGGTFSGRALFAVAANLPRFGGGMRIAPDATIDDGLIDLVIVSEIPRRTLLGVFPKVYRGRHVGHPAVTIVRTARAEITLDRAMTMYGGGEPLREMAAGEPAVVNVEPGGLKIVS